MPTNRALPVSGSDVLTFWRAVAGASTLPVALARVSQFLQASLGCARVHIYLGGDGAQALAGVRSGELPEALATYLTENPLPAAPEWLVHARFGLPGGVCVLPLRAGEEQIGLALALWPASDPAALSPEVLAALAEIVSYGVQHAWHAATVTRIERHLAVRDAILAALSQASSLAAALQGALDALCRHMTYAFGALYLLDSAGRTLVLSTYCGAPGVSAPARLHADAEPWQEALASAAFVILQDRADHNMVPEWLRKAGISHGVLARVRAPGRTLGLIALGASDLQPGYRDDGPLVQAVGLQLGVAVDRLQKSDALEIALGERNTRWHALYQMGAILTHESDPDRLLDEIVRRSVTLLKGNGGGVVVRDEASGELVLTVAHDQHGPVRQAFGKRLGAQEGLSGRVLATGTPSILEVCTDGSQAAADLWTNAPIAVVAVPLFILGKAAGVLMISDAPTRRFSEDDVQTLMLFAQMVSRVLEGQMSLRRAETLALQTERIRLANDLHDGLAQDLAALLLRADMAQGLLPPGDSPLRQQLELLSQGLQRSIRDARASIFALRASAGACGLENGLRALAQRFQAETQIPTQLTVNGEPCRMARQAWEMALMRVAQEALNNVWKHAHARQAWLDLFYLKDGTVTLDIRDDGVGFDPASDNRGMAGRFGLLSMREQLAQIGGHLQILSTPGSGTTIRVLVSGQHGAVEDE